jgi:hypothetical protein
MRTPFRWMYCVLFGASTAALAEQESSAARIGSLLFDRHVLTLLALGCLVGVIIGLLRRDPHEPRVRLVNKPKKTPLSILVPPGPAPRLIPGDSPHATRPRSTRAPVTRQTPIGAARPRVIDYLAAFADPAAASEEARVDYLLEESPPDPPGGIPRVD